MKPPFINLKHIDISIFMYLMSQLSREAIKRKSDKFFFQHWKMRTFYLQPAVLLITCLFLKDSLSLFFGSMTKIKAFN